MTPLRHRHRHRVPQARYEEYRRGTDFINSVVFPGSCCPSLTALLEVCVIVMSR